MSSQHRENFIQCLVPAVYINNRLLFLQSAVPDRLLPAVTASLTLGTDFPLLGLRMSGPIFSMSVLILREEFHQAFYL